MSKYRVIFLGPASSGKTSTIRSLLGSVANHDEASPTVGINTDTPGDVTSRQSHHKVHDAVILDKQVTLVDTPGPSNPQNDSDIDMDLRYAFHAIAPGPHVLVLVFSIATTHDIIRQTFTRYKERLGASVMRFTLILFTGVDQLETNGRTFQGYLAKLPTHIKQLIGGHNHVALNNNANAKLINILQVQEFMSKVEQIYHGHFGLHYQVKQSDMAVPPVPLTNVTEAFEKNLANLEHMDRELDRSQTKHRDHTSEESSSAEIVHQNGDADIVSSRPINAQNLQNPPEAILKGHEDLLLESVNNTQRETLKSRDGDEASMISQKKGKCTVFCCWSGNGDPEFTQFK